jgi:hypothetical protein
MPRRGHSLSQRASNAPPSQATLTRPTTDPSVIAPSRGRGCGCGFDLPTRLRPAAVRTGGVGEIRSDTSYARAVADDVAVGTVVERDEIPVMFQRVPDFPAGITRGWTEFEAKIGSLRGRKFFGAFGAGSGEYRVCAQLRDDDDPEALGLEVGTLPGGRYAGEAP